MVNYMQLPIQFTNYFLFPLHKKHLFAIKQQVSLVGILYQPIKCITIIFELNAKLLIAR